MDASQVDYLYCRLLDAQPPEVPVVRDALAPYQDALRDKLWTVVEAPEKGKEAQQLRAAVALAKYDPESEKWEKASSSVVDQLVAENPVFLGVWMKSLRPIKGKLLASLATIYGDANRRESERTLATSILADYAADQPGVLADLLLMDAADKQFAVIYPKLREQSAQGLPLLTGELDKELPLDLPSSDEQREKLAKRQANAAVALLRMNQPDKVWPLLQRAPPDDPRVRSYLIHRLAPLGADAGAIIKQLKGERDITIRRALLLSLGEFTDKGLDPAARTSLVPWLQTIYREDADPGLHAAAEWLLRTWKQQAWLKQVTDDWAKDKEQRAKRFSDIQQFVRKNKEKTPPQWYVNSQGQTMVVISGAVEFMMGSPKTEANRRPAEVQHQRRIARTFALAATPVTKEQFLRHRPTFTHVEFKCYPEPTCPIGGVTWYEAATYCNWLSKEEGIPEDQWCYEIKGNEIRLSANYLSLSGYRLPTEAELEYATRAGSVTSRYFGETEELLPKYASYFKNSKERTWPVGGKKPNDFGLFDVQGNVYMWCQESYQPYPQGEETTDDTEDTLVIATLSSRVLRGGSFLGRASNVRSAYRDVVVPAYRGVSNGFRPAKTLPLGSFLKRLTRAGVST
jgi:formylglycine-generating enzyme required for sulfatase activity